MQEALVDDGDWPSNVPFIMTFTIGESLVLSNRAFNLSSSSRQLPFDTALLISAHFNVMGLAPGSKLRTLPCRD